jgi:hypothetical protein
MNIKLNLLITVFFFSFTNNSTNANSSASLITNYYSQNDEEGEEFVELVNGKIIYGDIKKCNLFRTNSLQARGKGRIIIDDAEYKADEVFAYFYKKHYYRRGPGKDFLQRQTKGKLNVYRSDGMLMTGSTNIEFRYFQKGDKGELVEYDMDNLKLLTADNPEVVAILEKFETFSKRKKNTVSYETMVKCINIYNGEEE